MSGASKLKGNGDESKHFSPGDVVLGKIKGYPPWPGILVDEDSVPKKKVLSARPGKSYFIVRFFPAADYGFNKSNELRRLHKKEIEAYLGDPHKKAAELRSAYEIAKDPEEWNEEQNRIVRKAEAAGEDDEEEEDMLAEDEDEDEKPAKKRKLPAGNSSNKKVKLSTASSKKVVPKSNSVPRKSGATEGGDDGEDGELDPETKKVRAWRHTLQRGFLSKDGRIQVNDLDNLHKAMEQVEEYNGITADILRVTKIGKVMRRIIALEDIPREEEFKFKERAEKLCDKWTEVFSSVKSTTEGSAPPNSTAPEITNGAEGAKDMDMSTEASIPSKSEEPSN